ncbi:hypothetical protein TL16_g11595 [Triparma laevis f. inornata]|uniref:Guanine deaminase n=1 Tax=Triparma laevis f. inornata TaxID=1714386 RepID=A0A9W7ETY1_9STRA|nr:hypothetical protein TL16_g11595 [Triparma laevis f. inornata]
MKTQLRHLIDDDVASLTAAANDRAISPSLRNGFPTPYTQSHAEYFITVASRKASDLVLAIIDSSTPTTILGIISLLRSKPADPTVLELGYWLNPRYWNQGIITRSIDQILHFKSPIIPTMFRAEALVSVTNIGSSKALIKNNFKRDALLRNHNEKDGERRSDCHLYSKTIDQNSPPDTAFVRGNFVHSKENGELEILMDHLMEIDLLSGCIVTFEPADVSTFSSLHYLYKSPTSSDFITPGFIDCHVHAPQYSFAGTATDRPLMGKEGWLESYTFPSERRLSDQNLATKTYSKVVKRLLREGTTTACYLATIHLNSSLILADQCEKFNQRALIGKVNMDQNSPPDYIETTEESLANTETFIKQIQGRDSFKNGNIFPVITPRFIPTCSKALLSGLGRLAKKYDTRVQSHISESVDEVAFVKSLGYEETDAEIFQNYGLLKNSIQAHGVWCSKDDLGLMKENNAGIACCPLSNVYFASGILDLNICEEVSMRGAYRGA